MKRVLIVEDQPDIRKLIHMTLEFEAYEIHEAADGTTGLRMAQALQPDLMLLDVMMPGELDGLQVCQRVRRPGAGAREGGAADGARPGAGPRGWRQGRGRRIPSSSPSARCSSSTPSRS